MLIEVIFAIVFSVILFKFFQLLSTLSSNQQKNSDYYDYDANTVDDTKIISPNEAKIIADLKYRY